MDSSTFPSISPTSSFILSSSGSASTWSLSSETSSYSTSFCGRIRAHRNTNSDQTQNNDTTSNNHKLRVLPSFGSVVLKTTHRPEENIMASKNKNRIMLAIYSDTHSLSNSNSYSSLNDHHDHHNQTQYRWGILLRPKNSIGSDNTCLDIRYKENEPNNFSDRRLHPKKKSISWAPSPKGSRRKGWSSRKITQYNPLKDPTFLGQFMIGKIPVGKEHAEICNILEDIPLPRGRARQGSEDEIYWVQEALEFLQANELVESFDVLELLNCMRGLAEDLGNGGPFMFNYTSRPM